MPSTPSRTDTVALPHVFVDRSLGAVQVPMMLRQAGNADCDCAVFEVDAAPSSGVSFFDVRDGIVRPPVKVKGVFNGAH